MHRGVFTLLLSTLLAGLLTGPLSACGTDSESLRSDETEWPVPLDEDGTVLRWNVTFPGGYQQAQLKRNGRFEYELSYQRLHQEERTMSVEDMTLLRDDLARGGCCNLRGPWRDNDPEGMVEFQVRMPGFTCDLAMPTIFYELDPNVFRLCDARLGEEWSANRPPMSEVSESRWDIYVGPDKRAWSPPARPEPLF